MGETVKTEMAGNFSEASKLPPKSQALIYHVHLKEVFENYPDSPSLERTKICFEIFENIVDQTGHLSTVLSIIKDELRKSCFSDTVTAADVEPFYESLPYYMLNKKTSSTRIVEELDAKIQELELSLKLRQEEANLAYKQIILLKQRLEDLVKQNTGMTEEILEMKIIAENAKAEKDLALQRLSAAEIKFEKESIEAKYLQEKTKAAFEQLSAKKFENQAVMPEKSLFGPGTNAIPITAFGLLSNDIKQSVLLENQFNGMLDRLLDDYELNLNQLKAKKELGISEDVVAEECQNASNLYRKQVGSYRAEVKALKEHKLLLLLQKQKNELNVRLPAIEPKDVAARKNAVILHTSFDGGKTFQLHPANKYCPRCGDKVLFCPHLSHHASTLSFSDKAVIKFIRPDLKLRTIENNNIGCIDVQNGFTEDEDENVSEPFFKIWKEFYDKKGGFKPKHNRKIPLYNLLGLIDELYELKFVWDEEGYPLQSLSQSFYRLMHKKYVFEDLVIKVCHDWLHSFQEYETLNDQITMFVLQLSGIYQEQWKYMMLVKKLFADVAGTPLETEVLQSKTRALYPNRESSTYKRLEADYLLFCRKKVSVQTFLDYAFLQIAQKTDHNITLMESIIERFDTQHTGILSKGEFVQIMAKSIPLVDKESTESLYTLAEDEFGIDQVANGRLVMIGAFLIVLTAYQQNWTGDIVITRYGLDSLD